MNKIIIVCIGILLAMYLCTKEEDRIENTNIIEYEEFMGIDDPFAYCKSHLEVISKGLSVMSNNQPFIDMLHDMVADKFDGDYNVLFNDLIDECNLNNINLVDQMKLYLNSNSIDSSLLTTALSAFENIDGNTYYIQVYIPNFEEIASFGSNTPVSLGYYSDETKLSYIGYYSLNDNLNSVPDVDEGYTELSEVWVVSLNENVDNDGDLITPLDPSTGNPIPEVLIPIPPSGASSIDAEIYEMTVKEHKENWAAGKSDVAIRGFLTYHNGVDESGSPYYEYILSESSYRGTLIKQFKRDWVNNEVTQTVNFQIANEWEDEFYFINRVKLIITIFERDVWPAGLKQIPDVPMGGANLGMLYRSSNDLYYVAVLCSMSSENNYYNGMIINCDGINFNIQEKP